LEAKSCPIIGTRFRASGGPLPLVFAASAAEQRFQEPHPLNEISKGISMNF